MQVLYKYVTSDLTREEVEIINESLSIFSPKYPTNEESTLQKISPKRGGKRSWAKFQKIYNSPKMEDYYRFKEDFEHFYHTIQSTRFNLDRNGRYNVLWWKHDAMMLDHILTNYLVKKGKELSTDEHRDPSDRWDLIFIHKKCVEKLLKGVKQINVVFESNKIHEVGYD